MSKLILVGMLLVGAFSNAYATAVATKKPAVTPKTQSKKAPAKKPASIPLPELTQEQHLVAGKVVTGEVSCDAGVKVHVKPHSSAGRFTLESGRQSFQMEPTPTSTGAVRLEDSKTGAVWLQLGNKSMLLNERMGKRLADSCVNPQQAAIAKDMEKNAPPGLLDGGNTATPGR
jgi:hypothetical protein